KTGMELNDDVVIGGYHFITAAPIDYSNVVNAEGEAYMKERIEAAIAADGNEKPIFLTLHHAPWYTTIKSTETVYDQPFSNEFINYLKTRPNVILIHGHNHCSEYHPRTIWQDGFTVLNLGHVSNGSGATVEGELVFDRSNSEGVMLEIDENNVVTIKRMDFRNQCYIGEEWVLDIPGMVSNSDTSDADYEDYWKYTNARYNTAATPQFADSAEITASNVSVSSVNLSFPAASIDTTNGDDIVYNYRVKIINEKLQTLVQNYLVAADFYLPPAMRRTTLTIPVDELNINTQYIVEISAISAYGKESESITGSFRTAGGSADNSEDFVVTSPENDPRNPLYKYITDSEGVALFKEINSPGRNGFTEDNNQTFVPNEDSRVGFGGNFVAFYESGNYITYEFDVTEPGIYEVLGIAATSISSDMGVYIDRDKAGTLTIPVNNTNAALGALYTATYTSAGKCSLEAGTHTVTFKLDSQANEQVAFFGAALAKEKSAQIINMHCTEGTASPGHYADYSADAATNAYQFYDDGYGFIDFTVNAPVSGEYELTIEAAGDANDNTFTVLVDSAIKTTVNVKAGNISDITGYTAEAALRLDKGEHTVRILAGTTSLPYFRSMSLVSYDATDRWNTYSADSSAVTGYADGGSGDKNLSDGFSMMADTGYITYQVTPELTGKYNLFWDIQTGGCYGQSFVNGKAVSDKIHYSQSRGYTEAIEFVLIGGNTYDFTFEAVEAGEAEVSYFDFYNMMLEYTGEPDNGGEGVYYDIYAGDSNRDNYEEQSAAALKYGDGRGESGWGSYGGLYTEFDFTIEYAGWYNVNMVLGADNPAPVKLLIDSNEVGTKNAACAEGESWAVRRNNDFGEVFLFEGEHTLRISGVEVDGVFQIFKTSLTFNRTDDGTAKLEVIKEAQDLVDKGGSNMQMPEGGGVVLGEGNSYAEYEVDVPAGNYMLSICYGALELDGLAQISVNGGQLGTYSLPINGCWINGDSYYDIDILCLNEGANTIKIQCANGKYFSYSTFKLTRLSAPVSQLFSGQYITAGGQITDITEGDIVARAFLPTYMKDKAVSMYVAIYKNGQLYKIADAKTECAAVNDVLSARFTDVVVESDAEYKCKFFYWNAENPLNPITNAYTVMSN
ncbi:MAG: hypothetical protein IKV85_06785, partial [Ruminococcus sp.]|nr:hypothetical protein [Ruminococcus sp.]